jgi:hypothetical protein
MERRRRQILGEDEKGERIPHVGTVACVCLDHGKIRKKMGFAAQKK